MDTTPPTTDCWHWQGKKQTGYGVLIVAPGQPRVYAHRVSYALHVGPLKPDKVIDHKCEQRDCWNPDHLQQVAPAANIHASTVRRYNKLQADHDIVARYERGWSLNQLATTCGIGVAGLRSALKFHGVEIRKRGTYPRNS